MLYKYQTVNETELTYGDDLINLVEETMKQEPREENKIGKVNCHIMKVYYLMKLLELQLKLYLMSFLSRDR